jgi:hypothetical protein
VYYLLSGVGLTPGRTAEQKRHLTVGNGLFGQIVVDDDSVLAVVTEPDALLRWFHVEERRSTYHSPIEHPVKGAIYCIYSLVYVLRFCGWKTYLKRRSFGGGGGNDDGVLHGVVLFKGLDQLGNGGSLLSDGYVDTVELLLLVAAVVPSLLIKDGVESNGGLSGLTITNDQFTLATSNGHHGVDGLETSLHGLADGLTGENAGSLELGTALLGGLDGTLSVDGVAESVDYTSEKGLANWDVDLEVVS